MNHSTPYWQRAGEDDLQHIKLVGRAREIISYSRGDPPWMAVKHREVDVGDDEPFSPGNASRIDDSLLKVSSPARCLSARRVRRSLTTVFLAELFSGTLNQQRSSPPLDKPPTGFSESDVGKPPDIECDVGRMLDDLVSSELETTMLTDDEVHNGSCLTMESTRFQLCQN